MVIAAVHAVLQVSLELRRDGSKNKELFLRFLNGFSQYARLGRVRFRTDGGSSWNITVEEAREKFKDFWSPPLEELIQSWLRMEVRRRCAAPAPRTD